MALALIAAGCAPSGPEATVITVAGSAVGVEAELLERQIARIVELHPGIAVERQVAPDAGTQRHQLYVQWLAAGAGDLDVLQLDVVWTPELASPNGTSIRSPRFRGAKRARRR